MESGSNQNIYISKYALQKTKSSKKNTQKRGGKVIEITFNLGENKMPPMT